ncbi:MULTISPECIES: SDR family oxidoreductase [unclassified Shewanella]|uniref:dTDP-4-dehydrorhamnose reductase family protein n=1 Tax=unclassified Shewanella TaxID=196818 RepID=UPI001BB995BA|nr:MULTISPECIES: SDR family oxidoreductase [unclassified Shewanella]GIU18052.1 NAD(P)-dependent oxidoreductase [Shewanella sp. MBTL60-112-B1]GIU38897.1 NAD(P)-dependent oxidoreductase [Shewanella sp. MBTL60-112-B2]
MKVLIFGATGMLGYSLFTNLSDYKHLHVFGTVRNVNEKERFFKNLEHKLIEHVDVTEIASIEHAIQQVSPDVVLNCVGLIKQHDVSKQNVSAIEINSLLPHKLASLCNKHNAQLIHFSTDCVFDGQKGNYTESDLPTATDLYGKSKCLGEVNYDRHITLRTSIIGHELVTSVSLIDWFLSQNGEVNGFSKAIFSGLPTSYIAKILVDNVFEKTDLTGLYHLSVEPIDKFSLVSLVAEIYGKEITINPSADLVIDRSLDSTRFRELTGFVPPTWRELVEYMRKDYLKRYTS